MPSQTTTNQSEPSTVQATAASSAPDQDRRTIVMADQSGPARVTRGKIVGWLITYNRNPDGDDHRVYAGYNRLGANPVCDILIDDETVSGSHAIIVYREGRCLIKDDLSRNGTFVNGREITEAYPLQNYDQIRIGNTYLTFVSAQQIS
jgi:pSer/pThr/pTyr-binding forkhead associated (FHA) protein